MLSPAGEVFYGAYRDRLQRTEDVPILLSMQALDTYRSTAPEVRRVFDRAFAKLRLPELRASGADRVRNSDCLVYPKGHREERLFFFEAEDGGVRICEVSRHSDQSYERLIDRGVRRRDYGDFQKWPGQG